MRLTCEAGGTVTPEVINEINTGPSILTHLGWQAAQIYLFLTLGSCAKNMP